MSFVYEGIYIILVNLVLLLLSWEDSKSMTVPLVPYTGVLLGLVIAGLPIIFSNGILLVLSLGELLCLFIMKRVLAKADLIFMAVLSLTLPLLTIILYFYFTIRLLQKDIRGREFPFFRELQAAFILASFAYFIFYLL